MNQIEMVQNCENFQQLYKVLDEIGIVRGSRKEYTAERLKQKVEQLRVFVKGSDFKDVPWNVMTRTYGLRAKCMELFWYEMHGV